MSVVSENGSSHVRSSNDALNRTVLRSSRNAFKDETVLTLDGREFQAHAAATGKARSPIVDWQIDVSTCWPIKDGDEHQLQWPGEVTRRRRGKGTMPSYGGRDGPEHTTRI